MSRPVRVQLFERFLSQRLRAVGKFGSNRFLHYEDYLLPNNCLGIFSSMAGIYTRGLIGSLNRCFYDIYQADCWIQVTNSLETKVRMPILAEFTEPLLELSVGRPYSLRNQLIFAATHLLNQGNRYKQSNWRDRLPPDSKLNIRVLCAEGKDWATFKCFKSSLEALNDPTFVRRTQNFRNRMQHQFRQHFHLGLTPYWKRVKAGNGIVYELTAVPPLELENLIEVLVDQHAKALIAFEEYWKLIGEILTVWPRSRIKS